MREPRGLHKPKCAWCGAGLLFRRLTKVWVCPNEKCKGSPYSAFKLPPFGKMLEAIAEQGT